ncbi:unnamed protein product [Caenorhabditis nigoni]
MLKKKKKLLSLLTRWLRCVPGRCNGANKKQNVLKGIASLSLLRPHTIFNHPPRSTTQQLASVSGKCICS